MSPVFFAVTIDVEPDCTSNWVYSDPLTFTGVQKGVKTILQPLFNKYNIAPTYLINNVVLEDKESINIFKSLEGRFELGTHLHPEFIEPQKLYENYAGKKGEANCCFLPPFIESKKLQNITQLFLDQFGYRPASFRAGRFSAGSNTIKSLAELDYRVDTSVTPGILWNDKTREGIVDYSKQATAPYWVNAKSFPGSSTEKSILEIPVTIGEIKKYFIRSSVQWLRPYYSTTSEMVRLSKKIISCANQRQPIILNMMFHNVEVMPGLSPYSTNVASANRLLKQVENYLKWINASKIVPVTLSEFYEQFQDF